jgi:hypothetical protein
MIQTSFNLTRGHKFEYSFENAISLKVKIVELELSVWSYPTWEGLVEGWSQLPTGIYTHLKKSYINPNYII